MNNYKMPFMTDYENLDTYVVKKGDSLYNIAKQYNCNLEELKDVNKLATTMIYPNQVLFIPKSNIDSYITKQGDTMKTVISKLGIKFPSLNGYEELLYLELADNQQISTTDGSLVYKGEAIDEILSRNNISAKQFLELNKSSWLKSGSRFKIK